MNWIAHIKGGRHYPAVFGTVFWEKFFDGWIITAHIYNLPPFSREGKIIAPFGFHLHEGTSCLDEGTTPFPETKGHLNPDHQVHGHHVGDFPVLVPDTKNHAYLSFYNDRLTETDFAGHAVVIHLGPDDYVSQPSGNSGEKIACGILERYVPTF